MRIFHKVLRLVFLLYVLIALIYLGIGAMLLFAPHSMKPDPLAAAPVLIAGFPWSFAMVGLLTGLERSWILFAALGVIPLGLNTFLLWLLQRWAGKRAARNYPAQ
jgi:hypothetical protein